VYYNINQTICFNTHIVRPLHMKRQHCLKNNILEPKLYETTTTTTTTTTQTTTTITTTITTTTSSLSLKQQQQNHYEL